MVKITGIIPARMNSTRFPNKPLALLLGRTMIEHVYRRTIMCELLDSVYVATCDEEICNTVKNFGGEAIMTSPSHERASDRAAEAAEHIRADIILMVQGDEPMITSQMIDVSLAPMIQDSSVECVNLIKRINDAEEYKNPNTIKVVMNANGEALYFSRNPIPAVDFASATRPAIFKQVCVIPFRQKFLRKFASLRPTPLERAESIDMLRALENGLRVNLVETDVETHAVDTPYDLVDVENLMKNDPLISRY